MYVQCTGFTYWSRREAFYVVTVKMYITCNSNYQSNNMTRLGKVRGFLSFVCRTGG